MATASSSTTSLPPRLINFFARYPPSIYSAKYGKVPSPPLTRPQARASRAAAAGPTSSESSSSPLASAAPILTTQPISSSTESTTLPPQETSTTATISSPTVPPPPPLTTTEASEPYNPFLPWKNPVTGRWRGPAYSLRRQAELVKIARTYGVEELLPPSRKASAFKEAKAELGLRVRGTGEGQRVKGHKWERMKGVQLAERKKAMEGMPELIRLWKQRGHGKWWKKYPR
ncbi:putative 60s ribosomal protein l25 [Phaeomoniella chlamydospora]|uniref:Putative 60s ribosomal protein l25 n=1 Tax=Phaeomoniella chlamydospora TaxID=158046 RepID=A0A0G2H973_PHACM|nr:putative 60s ribosomal protein l25 [Phaeomoniella chlamydospora]